MSMNVYERHTASVYEGRCVHLRGDESVSRNMKDKADRHARAGGLCVGGRGGPKSNQQTGDSVSYPTKNKKAKLDLHPTSLAFLN